MVLTEFDEEKFLRMVREEERAEGHKAGLRAGRLEDLMDRLRELGEISSEFAERIKTLDTDSLKKWNRLAARAESMEAFLEQIKGQ